ncbi:AzlC family ABC transporter permease [Streptomyces sp. NBC_01549]|uniref:AzlC family ABC transporter permease n=1 Tax=Streptomyces sp. NBC_01549 TaxID=2975874 RepID=UPI00225173BA|nr:AzlC family ABC transporter permease [Streptomyces sp. NBC_01549]MCX4594516.1 AzlC family ABC transporter permease [Streptomyces sp. NBC_01549]
MHHHVPSRTATPDAAPVAARAPADRRHQITLGVRDSFSAGLGIFPLGIALGLLIIQAGLPWWLAPALSLAAFAGSLELLLVGMMATVTPLAAMIDEAYAVNASLPEAERSAARLLAMQIACETYWVGGGLVGVALGAALPAPIKGLEFALCALFTVLTLDALRSRGEIPSVLFAGASATVALVLTPGLAMFTALLMFVGLLLVRHTLTARRPTQETADA